MTKLILVVGGKGKGKTWLTRKTYINDSDTQRSDTKCNVLVVDAFDEYKGILEIKPSEVSEFCKQKTPSVRRIKITGQNSGLNDELFIRTLNNFDEGVLIGDAFVDMSRSVQVNQEIYEIMSVKQRHNAEKKLEIILHFHNHNTIPKKWLTIPEGLRLYQEM